MGVPKGQSVLERFHETHLKNIPNGGHVPDATVLVVRLQPAVVAACNLPSHRVYIKARALKHIYERHEDDFSFVTNNIWSALKHPAQVYKNVDGKTGHRLFVRVMDNNKRFVCVVEITEVAQANQPALFITTVFRNGRENYLKKRELLWARQTELIKKM